MNLLQVKRRTWFLKRGLTQAQIAREAGVTEALVCMTLSGKRENSSVLEILAKHGFPRRLLGSGEEAA